MPAITDPSVCAANGGSMVDGQCMIKSPSGDILLTLEQVTAQETANEIIKTGKFIPKTTYLPLPDLPIYARSLKEPVGVVSLDLQASLPTDKYKEIADALVKLPYSELGNYFVSVIWAKAPTKEVLPVAIGSVSPSPKKLYVKMMPAQPQVFVADKAVNVSLSQQDLMWAGILEVFRAVNLQYTLDHGISPAEWEKTKTDAFLISQNPDAKANIEKTIQTSIDVSTDPKAVPILQDYLTLPKLGDAALEIDRQAAIKELLIRKEYETAQAVINVYKYALEAGLGSAMSKPLPFEINK